MRLLLGADAQEIGQVFTDPALSIACVLLITVSAAWLVLTRLIVRHARKAALRGERVPRIDVVAPPRDIWSYPPEAPARPRRVAWESATRPAWHEAPRRPA